MNKFPVIAVLVATFSLGACANKNENAPRQTAQGVVEIEMPSPQVQQQPAAAPVVTVLPSGQEPAQGAAKLVVHCTTVPVPGSQVALVRKAMEAGKWCRDLVEFKVVTENGIGTFSAPMLNGQIRLEIPAALVAQGNLTFLAKAVNGAVTELNLAKVHPVNGMHLTSKKLEVGELIALMESKKK